MSAVQRLRDMVERREARTKLRRVRRDLDNLARRPGSLVQAHRHSPNEIVALRQTVLNLLFGSNIHWQDGVVTMANNAFSLIDGVSFYIVNGESGDDILEDILGARGGELIAIAANSDNLTLQHATGTAGTYLLIPGSDDIILAPPGLCILYNLVDVGWFPLGLVNGRFTRTMSIKAGALHPTETNGCGDLERIETSTNNVNHDVLPFDKDADEYAYVADFPLPTNLDPDKPVSVRFVWSGPSNPGASEGVTWGVQMQYIGQNQDIDQAFPSATLVNQSFGTSDAGERKVTSAASHTPTKQGSSSFGLYLQVHRDVSDANDDYSFDARLHAIHIEYQTRGMQG